MNCLKWLEIAKGITQSKKQFGIGLTYIGSRNIVVNGIVT